ncbi:plexin-B2-like isoform X2 [Mytilus edulis]|uniref:plexin-B2-like isoform X2 n=1 Tax=Mytilus edulis TaxID=6550 RepID=UPI0039EE95A9
MLILSPFKIFCRSTDDTSMLLVLIIHTIVLLIVAAQRDLGEHDKHGVATQSSLSKQWPGKAENAIKSPISNNFEVQTCTHTYPTPEPAWWMFAFSFGFAYITDIKIYYRENYAVRMNGFKLYLSNTSIIPPEGPEGYLCYNDTESGLPNITQTISCNHLGQYVIYYQDSKGSLIGNESYNIIELCYVAIHGCQMTFWGSTCEFSCPESCKEHHCFPENGACIWGCIGKNCLKDICDPDTGVCLKGCKDRRTGPDCNKYNLAFNSSVIFSNNDTQLASLSIDGNNTSCVTRQASEILVQVDIKEISIVTDIYLNLSVNITDGGYHTVYVSNTSGVQGNNIYSNESVPSKIKVNAVFRYLTYQHLQKGEKNFLEVCEIGIVGCPPTNYGPLCNKWCPVNCSGPCDLETGHCSFGCVNGWIGDKCELDAECFEDSETPVLKCRPEIYKVYPSTGPIQGGTLLTITGKYLGNVNDRISVKFNGVRCNNVTVQSPNSIYTSLTCVTGEYDDLKTKGILVSVNENNFSDHNSTRFSYKEPILSEFSPTRGILSGDTTVTISGDNIGFEEANRYHISFCVDWDCKQCRTFQTSSSTEFIKCKTTRSNQPRNMTRLRVVIDGLTELLLNETFQYLPDPTFNVSNKTRKAQQSGGATFTIHGGGFNNVGDITVERVVNPCDVPEDTSAVCETPPKQKNQSNSQTVYVHFDGVKIPVNIEYVDDPTFEKFQGVYKYDKESSIKIKGRNILNGARLENYRIHIGLDGRCLIADINMQFIICFPPSSVPRTNNTNFNIAHVIVTVGNIEAYIGELHYKEDINTLVIIAGVLVAALITAIVIGVLAVVILRKQKKRDVKEFRIELMTREEMIRKASREEFADAQMNIKDIKSNLVTSRIPYFDYQTYVCHQLFPNEDKLSNPLTNGSEITDDRNTIIKSAMEKFEILLSNKLFLKSLVQTLDRPNMLTMQEKAQFSSVLSISLLGNMRLFFDLIHCLLVDMVRSSTKKQQKVLFRRFDSITLRLMVNWLQIAIYKELSPHSGLQLFMLYKAVQTITEMGPIDALTGNSKNTIAEEKLLKIRIEHQNLTLQIDLNGNSDQHFPVKVLDCDTISQVKQKCCAQVYKNKPASEIPQHDELFLEWQEGKAGKLTLNDIDNTSARNNGLICLNTLKHYMVKDNCRMALMYKPHGEQEICVNSQGKEIENATSETISLLLSNDGEEDSKLQQWHLLSYFPVQSSR